MSPSPTDADAREDRSLARLTPGLRTEVAGLRHLTAPPALTTGSTQMLRPMAGAIIRSSAITRSNCAGTSTAHRRFNAVVGLRCALRQ